MLLNNIVELYQKAVRVWGAQAQTMMFVEEVGEALTALSHYDRGRCDASHIVEEMVDVVIMAEQMAMVHVNLEEYQEIRSRKLARLGERLM
jgi:NTP pyrophosphatase (non-canonical NTP hydrolase)